MTDDDSVDRLNALARSENWPTRADKTMSFRHPELLWVYALWKSFRKPGGLPARSDLTARTLRRFLKHLVITRIASEPGGSTRYLHRYVGRAITERLGELTGLAFEDFLTPESVRQWSAVMTTVVETRRALRVVTQSYLQFDGYRWAELFVAPLADDGVVPDRVISVVYFSWDLEHALSSVLQEL